MFKHCSNIVANIGDDCEEEYNNALVDNTKQMVVQGEFCLFDVIDTCGLEEFPHQEEQWLRVHAPAE